MDGAGDIMTIEDAFLVSQNAQNLFRFSSDELGVLLGCFVFQTSSGNIQPAPFHLADMDTHMLGW